MKAIDRIIELLPLPLLIACALLFAWGWTVKELKSLATYGEVLRHAWFQVGCVVAIAGTVAFYLSALILARSGPDYFSDKERGIFVARFDGDSENKVQREASESLKDELSHAQSVSDVRIVRLSDVLTDATAASRELKNRHARMAIFGSFTPPDLVHVSVVTPKGDETRVRIDKFPDVKPLTSTVLGFLEITPPAPGAKPEDQISFLKRRIDILEHQQQQFTVQPSEAVSRLVPQHLRVLTIGIDRYQSSEIQALRYAVGDAKAIGEVFRSQGSEVSMLINPTRNQILSALHDLHRQSQAEDTVLIYWQGVSFSSGNDTYFVPTDGSLKSTADAANSLVSVSSLLQDTKAMPAERVALFLDAGLATARVSGGEIASIQEPSGAGKQVRAILSAASGTQSAVESAGVGHSVFAYVLLKGLTTGQADSNGDGVITLREVAAYVQREVPQFSAQIGFLQSPVFQYEGSGDIPLVNYKREARNAELTEPSVGKD